MIKGRYHHLRLIRQSPKILIFLVSMQTGRGRSIQLRHVQVTITLKNHIAFEHDLQLRKEYLGQT